MMRQTLLRPLRASGTRLPAVSASVAARRSLATEAPRPANNATSTTSPSAEKPNFTTVEELHSRTAAEILKERDAGSHAGEMRHFTVNFGERRSAVLRRCL